MKDYSFEELIIETIRRGYMTIEEGKVCLASGTISEEIEMKRDERMKLDPAADIPGSKKIDSEQQHMKEYLKIRFLLNLDTSN